MSVLIRWAAFRAGGPADDGALADYSDAGPDQAVMSTVACEMSISIPRNLVPALRSASFANLGIAAESVAALTSAANRETNPAAYTPLVNRIDGARALLDVLGWQAHAPEGAVGLTAGLREPITAALELGLLLAETPVETAGNAEDGEALARLSREMRSARIISEDEHDQVLSRHLRWIALGRPSSR